MSFLLVSDLDDTLKISETSDYFKTVVRGLFRKDAYAGMNILYQELIGPKGMFVLISSSPRSIHGKVHRFLEKHKFPEHQIWLRDWVKQPKIKEYKRSNFQRLKETFPGPFIILGDDQEYDPEVFTEFKEANPDLVLKIYIRRIRGRKLPKGCFGFLTAFDIALEEYREKRLKIPQVSRIGKAVLEELDDDLIIPRFSLIKEFEDLEDCPPTLMALKTKLEQRLMDILQRGPTGKKTALKRLKDH